MSTTITTTSTSSAVSPTPTSCGAGVYEIPTTDAACAVPQQGNYSDIMKQCCGVATVQSYDNNCGLYCLAQDQSVGNLTSCLTTHGAKDSLVFCNQNQSATATATVSASSTSTSTSSSTSGKTTSTSAAGAKAVVSKSGLGVLALLFCSTLLGSVA
jgi:hypothetical protein